MQMIKRLLLVLCTVGLLVSGVGMTLAYRAGDTPTVLYDGAAQTLTILNAQNADLFVGMKDLMPGDTRTQQIDLQAQNLTGKTALYLKANSSEQTEQALKKLTLSVYTGQTKVASGPAGGDKALEDGILLYEFSGAETVPLRVELQVPTDVGNELAEARHQLQWVFTVQAEDAGAGNGAVTLVPQTKDTLPVGLWQGIFCLSAAGVLALICLRRGKKRAEEP